MSIVGAEHLPNEMAQNMNKEKIKNYLQKFQNEKTFYRYTLSDSDWASQYTKLSANKPKIMKNKAKTHIGRRCMG